MCVRQNSLGEGVRDSFKINHQTFLRLHLSIGYLEPLVLFFSFIFGVTLVHANLCMHILV